MRPLSGVRALPGEAAEPRAGDGIVPVAAVVMDRGVTLDAAPRVVWPWLVQLGKGRAGWYLPGWAERAVPPTRRALRHIDPGWQHLAVGDVVPDYGGRGATFEVAVLHAPTELVYRSRRRRMDLSWSLTLTPTPAGPPDPTGTRLHLRLRLGPVRRRWLAESVGELFDVLTIAGMAAGLRERLDASR